MKRLALLLAVYASFAVGRSPIKSLPAAELAAFKKKPCALLHIWATWCTICVEELPAVLKFLAETKTVTPVVIDVSSPSVQKSFSKQMMRNLNPPFTTYVKPAGKDDVYLNAVDESWNGALPFTVLFHNGVKKQTWTGQTDIAAIRKLLPELCK